MYQIMYITLHIYRKRLHNDSYNIQVQVTTLCCVVHICEFAFFSISWAAHQVFSVLYGMQPTGAANTLTCCEYSTAFNNTRTGSYYRSDSQQPKPSFVLGHREYSGSCKTLYTIPVWPDLILIPINEWMWVFQWYYVQCYDNHKCNCSVKWWI